mgnify:CR=1 FL=1
MSLVLPQVVVRLVAEQRNLIWKRCHEQSEIWHAEQQRIQDEANRKRSEATKEQPRTEDGLWQDKEAGGGTSSATTREPKEHKSRTAKAAASKTNRGTVERMDRLEHGRPDLADKVVTGELPAAAALPATNNR